MVETIEVNKHTCFEKRVKIRVVITDSVLCLIALAMMVSGALMIGLNPQVHDISKWLISGAFAVIAIASLIWPTE